MPSFSTAALVLRRAPYSDNDRMVTLFSRDYGRIDAIARGCRRPKSPLLNCCEPFVSGDFQLFRKGEHVSIEQCQISESCFELRSDYDRLKHGAYWLRLLDSCIMPNSPMPELFLISLKALAHLNYSQLQPELLTMAFEMHLMKQLGLAPRVDVCQRCGRPINGDARFDAQMGGCVCLQCSSDAPEISNGARRIMLKLPRTRYEQVKLLDGHPDWPEAAQLFRPYVSMNVPTQKSAPGLYGAGEK